MGVCYDQHHACLEGYLTGMERLRSTAIRGDSTSTFQFRREAREGRVSWTQGPHAVAGYTVRFSERPVGFFHAPRNTALPTLHLIINGQFPLRPRNQHRLETDQVSKRDGGNNPGYAEMESGGTSRTTEVQPPRHRAVLSQRTC